MAIAGRATVEATQAYRDRFPHLASAVLGQTGLHVSQAGFGCYRIDDRSQTQRESLKQALLQGINLIDTSANYSDGHSERLIGQVLRELDEAGAVPRSAVVVVSKGGYIQGQNFALAQQREREGKPYPEVVKLGDDLWHCLHPDFLADQLTRSLNRLGLAALDVYLLHNPEYFLKSKGPGVTTEDRLEYERRLQEAFRYLESQVAAGRIGAYGLSSNTFPDAADEPEFTSLERCLALASAISPTHHLQVIQLPANLSERGFVLTANQSEGRSVLTLARDGGLGVLINRPLNAFSGQGMVRLADAPAGRPVEMAELQAQMQRVIALEARFFAAVPHDRSQAGALQQCLSIGELLQVNLPDIRGREHWQDVMAYYLAPRLEHAWHVLSQQPSDALDEWLEEYRGAVKDLLSLMEAHFQAQAHAQAERLHGKVDPLLPAEWQGSTLSQSAVGLLRSLDGVSCVLVGMRRAAYVEDVLAGLQLPRIPDAERIWRTLSL